MAGGTGGDNDEAKLSGGRIFGAVLWVGGVLVLGAVTRLDPDLRLCKTTITETTASTSTETSTGKDGTVEKTTETPESSETTTACEPVGTAELALLMLPVLIFIWPALKGFNIGGIGVDLREIERKAVATAQEVAQEQVIRVIVENNLGTKTEKALKQADAGEVVDLPDV